MLTAISQRLLSLLQLTRMALVFTAIADAQAAMLLAEGVRHPPGTPLSPYLNISKMLAVAAMSIGLYGFGMSLNDIIDRRRDRLIASHRPLPSGRVGVAAAHVVCVLLALTALGGGIVFHESGGNTFGLVLLGVTLTLITFYDLAGKYLVGAGLLTLGLVRAFHACVPVASLRSPYVPVIVHPLLLLNHVTILSTVAYLWEQKRPPLTKRHWWGLLGSLAAIDVVGVCAVGRSLQAPFIEPLNLQWGLLLPAAALVAFIIVAIVIKRTSRTSREAGQKLMLFGLLWLILYDACFVAGYVSVVAALLLLLLLPMAYFSVQLMRWWGKITAVSHRPQFKRAGV